MHRKWQQVLSTTALGLLLAIPVAGCGARPAPRPEPGAVAPAGPIDPDLSAAIARTASGVGGTGVVEAVATGHLALIAIELNATVPGGIGGGPIIGSVSNPDSPGTSTAGGPRRMKGAGGGLAASPALPGGAINPGGATPGGTPNSTQAAPNGRGGLATQSPGGSAPFPTSGAYGGTPMDVMNRVADQVLVRHKAVTEVRFATRPDDAVRLAQIARAVRTGQPAAGFESELREIAGRSLPAGEIQFSPMEPAPGEGYHQQNQEQR